MYKIGIIGKGFVGSAVFNGFRNDKNFKSQIKVYDKNKKLSSHSLEETVNESDYIFLSIPTPANIDGSINLDMLEGCLSEISLVQKNDCIILIRSTIVPGSTSYFAKKFPKLKIVFNPEFLTEKNANEDFVNQSRVILGGDKDCTHKVKRLYRKRFGSLLPVICTNYETAELIKYMNNCFLATKVSFMNEMKILSNHLNVDWEEAVEGFALDERVGDSHLNVPGHDGKLGFGGSCFPKDMQALIYFSKQLKIDLNVLQGAWKTNLDLRPEKDWEMLKGRAVIDTKNN
tara:strand:+ start:6176 stop:7036 length:861 start_codon:yes stop_codon:yes gene_type:complete